MIKVFIDGKEGTTGLQLFDRLKARTEIEILGLSEALRKDMAAREEMLNKADFAFLCLPDAAAKDAVSLVKNDSTKIIDASTAHRTSSGWAYGFPELSAKHKEDIINGKRIAVPGCHASGFIAAVYPLLTTGIVGENYPFAVTSITGFSGGGKQMIAQYGNGGNAELKSPRQYATSQQHKHLKEMAYITGLTRIPVFEPYVANYYSGIEVTVPLFSDLMKMPMSVDKLYKFYKDYYGGQKFIGVERIGNCFIAANSESGNNGMRLLVGGDDARPIVIAVYDNLGKGASGAAVQCFNLSAGFDEAAGLL